MIARSTTNHHPSANNNNNSGNHRLVVPKKTLAVVLLVLSLLATAHFFSTNPRQQYDRLLSSIKTTPSNNNNNNNNKTPWKNETTMPPLRGGAMIARRGAESSTTTDKEEAQESKNKSNNKTIMNETLLQDDDNNKDSSVNNETTTVVVFDKPDFDKSYYWNKKWDTKVLRALKLPRWKQSKNHALEDRLGDIWLPPRLPLPSDDIRKLPYGTLFCGTGSLEYAHKNMVPMIRYLKEVLRIPDAKERAAQRRQRRRLNKKKTGGNRKANNTASGSNQGFALVTSRQFVQDADAPLYDLVSFFDAVYLVEDLPVYPAPYKMPNSILENGNSRAKATKVHAMASAPFDITIMLDFDSFPCRQNFGLPLLTQLGGGDLAITNQLPLLNLRDDQEFLVEHNTAVVVLNMTSLRTRLLLGLYVESFHQQHQLGRPNLWPRKGQRDQPAFMVAMQAMMASSEKFQLDNDDDESTLAKPVIPNKFVRDLLMNQKNLGSLQHTDIDPSIVCRGSTGGPRHCGTDSSCAIVHKAKEIRLQPNQELQSINGLLGIHHDKKRLK